MTVEQRNSEQSNAEEATAAHPQTHLARLAHRMGIEQQFQNAHGAYVATTDAINRSLLQAMGIATTTDSDASEALDDVERTEWLRPLPPVRVVRSDDDPITIDLSLPAGTATVSWQLTLEGGDQHRGAVDFTCLSLIEQHTLDGQHFERRRLPLPSALPWGYHSLELTSAHPESSPNRAASRRDSPEMTLIVTPARCWLPVGLEDGKRRIWGLAAQLYLIRSHGNWGIGDFSDLSTLIEFGAAHGADVIGLNPLHALFPDNPEQASPYSPASRLLLNPLNIDVSAIPELSACEPAQRRIRSADFQQLLTRCREQYLLDYATVAALKLEVLTMLFDACRLASNPARWRAFEQYKQERGEPLLQTCVFFALRESFAGADPGDADWRRWPAEFRDSHSPAVRLFGLDERHRIDFFAWLQWIAEEQLAAAAAVATRHGMTLGVYRDLAVGADAAGAETWVNPSAVISQAHVGAPPDQHNPAGQDWGLPPFNPRALREERYRSFMQLIRTNMRHAGGLRIDHVMGLQQLYCIPAGSAPNEGAYIRYPLADLIGILALESHREHCIVVGEDLGTVTRAFRDSMMQANILSYRVLFFEQSQETGAYLPPDAYPRLSLAVSGSHDLATLRGWWNMADIETKARLGLYPTPEEDAHQRATRQRDKLRLLEALHLEGLLEECVAPAIDDFVRAASDFLARTRSLLAMVQLDDLTAETDQVNVPATSDEHPNWRRRLSTTLEDLPLRPAVVEVLTAFKINRGLPPPGAQTS